MIEGLRPKHELADAIKSGGSVIFEGRIITSEHELPDNEMIARLNLENARKQHADLQEKLKQLEAELAQASGDTQEPAESAQEPEDQKVTKKQDVPEEAHKMRPLEDLLKKK